MLNRKQINVVRFCANDPQIHNMLVCRTHKPNTIDAALALRLAIIGKTQDLDLISLQVIEYREITNVYDQQLADDVIASGNS